MLNYYHRSTYSNIFNKISEILIQNYIKICQYCYKQELFLYNSLKEIIINS